MTKTDDRIERKFNSSDGCFLQESNLIESNISMAFFIMDFKNNQ